MKTIFIPGRAQAQGRARFAKIGGFVRAYDPKESRDYKTLVKHVATVEGWTPTSLPCELIVEVYVARPQRLMRKSDPSGPILCLAKPDCSNYLKGVEDALNGIAYHDDSQLWRSSASKFYHAKDGRPGLWVGLSIFENPDMTAKPVLAAQWPMAGEITMPAARAAA